MTSEPIDVRTLRPEVTPEVATVYRVGRTGQRFFTLAGACNKAAWRMIDEKYPQDDHVCHETGYYPEPWNHDEYRPLQQRISRWLQYRARKALPTPEDA